MKPKNLCLQITWPKDYPESDNAIIDLDSFFNSHIKVTVFNLYRPYTYEGVFAIYISSNSKLGIKVKGFWTLDPQFYSQLEEITGKYSLALAMSLSELPCEQ